jgi:hypothetical protein
MTGRYLIFFSSLALFLHELHELAHTATGRLICGAWGDRDFNLWRLAAGCTSYVPTAIGPLFSYAVMFAGVVLISSTRYRLLGIALALAPNPFARIFTALMGGGDEMVLARVIAGSGKTPLLRLLVIAVVAALTLPPIIAAWRGLRGTSHRVRWYSTLLLAPMVLTGVLYFVIGNRLLRAGVLVEPRIGGDPLLIFITTVLTGVLAAATLKPATSLDAPDGISGAPHQQELPTMQ